MTVEHMSDSMSPGEYFAWQGYYLYRAQQKELAEKEYE